MGHVTKPVMDALETALKGLIVDDVRSKARAMVHPKQYVHELGGGVLSVKSWREEVLAIKRSCPVWKDGGMWGKAQRDGSNHIGLIESFGIDILGIEEKSAHVARNRACAITMEVFEKHPDLVDKLKHLAQLLQGKDVKTDEEKEDAVTSNIAKT